VEKNIYPFPAIVGQEKVKKAILLSLINPNIKGVLISGEKGTAKSTVVRSIVSIAPWLHIVELPLNITEDRLLGSIDIEKAILNGEKAFDEGLLKKAHENILYIDEVNLLSESIVNSLLQVASSGENVVEREGISFSHPSKFVLIGTMNPEEGELKSQFIDKFGLYVHVEGEKSVEERVEIVNRRLEYEKSSESFYEKWKYECDKCTKTIKKAIDTIDKVTISQEILDMILKIVNMANCQGNRAEIIMVETAKTLAALDGREEVTEKDVREAMEYVLPHRGNISEPQENEDNSSEENEENRDEQNEENEENRDDNEKLDNLDDILDDLKDLMNNNPTSEDEIVENIGEVFKAKNLFNDRKDRMKRSGSGKRLKTRTSLKEGRYVRYRLKNGEISDIALDGTIRAAALYQNIRDRRNVALAIEKCDLRQKMREKRTGTTIIFVVDASGSICAQKRMEAAKGAIMSLLTDAYEKRDKVAMIAFRKDKAEVLLQVTRSVDLAQRCLRDLPAGGKTPLAAGLNSAYELIRRESLRDKEMIPFVVLISDGRANVSLNGGDPLEEALYIGEKIGKQGIRSAVIDTESGFVKFGTLKRLATVMDSNYYRIEDLDDKKIVNTVKNLAKPSL